MTTIMRTKATQSTQSIYNIPKQFTLQLELLHISSNNRPQSTEWGSDAYSMYDWIECMHVCKSHTYGP